MISFEEIESSKCKRRRCLLRPLPKDAGDFSKVIVASPFTHLYRGTVKHDGAVAVILARDFMLKKVSDANIIQFDGTFPRRHHKNSALFSFYVLEFISHIALSFSVLLLFCFLLLSNNESMINTICVLVYWLN